MAASFNEMVGEWYVKMHGEFIGVLLEKYRNSGLRREDAEDIYQEVYMSIRENMEKGRVADATTWKSYIMKIGFNMASKKYGVISKFDSMDEGWDSEERDMRAYERFLSQTDEDDYSIYRDEDVMRILEEEMGRMPEAHSRIIILTYFEGMSDARIVEVQDRFKNTKSVKAKRCQLMKQLGQRVRSRCLEEGLLGSEREKRMVSAA